MIIFSFYFGGSKLYSNLVDKIICYMNYTSKLPYTSARKVINQYVKIEFIYPFLSATTVDNRSFGEVQFLLRTMKFNRYLTKEDIKALMGTDISLIEKGYLEKGKLKQKYEELLEKNYYDKENSVWSYDKLFK